MTLLAEAEQAGRLRPEPMLTRLSFIAGAVLAPMLMLAARARWRDAGRIWRRCWTRR